MVSVATHARSINARSIAVGTSASVRSTCGPMPTANTAIGTIRVPSSDDMTHDTVEQGRYRCGPPIQPAETCSVVQRREAPDEARHVRPTEIVILVRALRDSERVRLLDRDGHGGRSFVSVRFQTEPVIDDR